MDGLSEKGMEETIKNKCRPQRKENEEVKKNWAEEKRNEKERTAQIMLIRKRGKRNQRKEELERTNECNQYKTVLTILMTTCDIAYEAC